MTDLTNKIIPVPPTAAALGFFDGLHLGHMKVVEECFEHEGLCPAMFTFHSDEILPKRQRAENLLTNDMKLERLEKSGLKYIYSPAFDSVKSYTARDFIEKALCAGYGIEVVIIPPFSLDGMVVHSTAIKNYIKSGELAKANRLLGYDFSFEGEVIYGNQLGRTLDCPTINQIYPANLVMPKFGAYKSVAEVDGKLLPSLTNIGVKPTVGGVDAPLAETHILGYDGDLYGRVLRVSLRDFMREEQRFDSIEQLRQRLSQDKTEAAR